MVYRCPLSDTCDDDLGASRSAILICMSMPKGERAVCNQKQQTNICILHCSLSDKIYIRPKVDTCTPGLRCDRQGFDGLQLGYAVMKQISPCQYISCMPLDHCSPHPTSHARSLGPFLPIYPPTCLHAHSAHTSLPISLPTPHPVHHH